MTLNRLNFYPKQIVTDTDLNTLQANVENADYNLAMDLGLSGVVSGLEVSPNSPNDLKVAYTKGVAYDAYGKRIAASGNGLIDCSSYTVLNDGYERWISIVIEFARNAYDARVVDSGTIYYYQDAYFAIGIVTGITAATGTATRPAVSASQVVLADIYLPYGLTAITEEYIDPVRRQTLKNTEEHSTQKVYDDTGVHGFITEQAGEAKDGMVLKYDHTQKKHVYNAIDIGRRGKQLFIVSGTFIVPDDITKVWVTICPGGQGGYGSYNYGNSDGYQGGTAYTNGANGAGVWAREVSVTPGENIPVAIGAGGSPGADGYTYEGLVDTPPPQAIGAIGGNSSFGDYLTASGTGYNGLAVWGYGIGGARQSTGLSGACLVEW